MKRSTKNRRGCLRRGACGLAGLLSALCLLSACQTEEALSSSLPPAASSQVQGEKAEEKPSLVLSDSVSQSEHSASVVSLAPEASSAISSAPSSAAPSSAPAASSALSAVSSGAGTSSVPAVSSEILSDAVFLGNSLIDDLYTYGVAGSADFYFRIGLTVKTVFTKTTATGSVPVIDELKNRSYGKVILLFGENELGWSYPSVFIQDYGKVIDAVRERQPNAAIYIQSIFPVSAAVSQKNQNQINNARIDQYNAMLSQLAQEKGVGYLDVASVLKDAQGNLPDSAAPDGIHLNRAYCVKWADYIKQELAKEN